MKTRLTQYLLAVPRAITCNDQPELEMISPIYLTL